MLLYIPCTLVSVVCGILTPSGIALQAIDVHYRQMLHDTQHASRRSMTCHPTTAAAAVGVVSRDDMQIMLRQLAGSSLSDDDISALISKAFEEAHCNHVGLKLQDFTEALKDQELGGMVVEVPTEL